MLPPVSVTSPFDSSTQTAPSGVIVRWYARPAAMAIFGLESHV